MATTGLHPNAYHLSQSQSTSSTSISASVITNDRSLASSASSLSLERGSSSGSSDSEKSGPKRRRSVRVRVKELAIKSIPNFLKSSNSSKGVSSDGYSESGGSEAPTAVSSTDTLIDGHLAPKIERPGNSRSSSFYSAILDTVRPANYSFPSFSAFPSKSLSSSSGYDSGSPRTGLHDTSGAPRSVIPASCSSRQRTLLLVMVVIFVLVSTRLLFVSTSALPPMDEILEDLAYTIDHPYFHGFTATLVLLVVLWTRMWEKSPALCSFVVSFAVGHGMLLWWAMIITQQSEERMLMEYWARKYSSVLAEMD
ncbi:uncharacterized protein STEHIDRAFT_112939 [Stereum hirsutum FP-91666 SS1]|uniref:uncharacterized protein n=1 Tax=Stereum hirsutum (strain FP-91666) TaxID=721885 RepID=UPI0004449936|nr:uncharacterized protein STEHIDRAFT_112939 [Stereum hirsutum FP-91666 SS1]EIM84607.1 hypothetical protein STEHIDRAFT_112939 [Stereum hirsutum FP-91666 SS1]